MAQPLEYPAKQHGEQSWIYNLSGDLYGTRGGYDFQDDVREKFAGGAQAVVVDLSDVRSIDSSGIGILVTMMWSASRARGRLVMVGIPPNVRDVLAMAMLLDRIEQAGSIDEALKKVSA